MFRAIVVGLLVYGTISLINNKSLLDDIKGGLRQARFSEPNNLPECDSARAKQEIKNAFYEGPNGRVKGGSIILIDGIQTDYHSKTDIKCSARAELNDTTDHQIVYRFGYKDDNIMVTINFVD